MIAGPRVFAIASLGLALSCTMLPDVPAGICGNAVIEANEDCDTFAPDAKSVCRPKGSEGECHLDCRLRNDGTRSACPDGWGCDFDGICRSPMGTFELPVEFKVGGASSLSTGDFDGDGRAEIVSREPLDVYGRSRLRFHYFDERGVLAETRAFPKLVASPVIADISGDGRSDIAFSDFRVGLLLGQRDRGLVPETFGSYHVPAAKVRMVSVYDELIANDGALFAVTTLSGTPGYYLPDPSASGNLRLRGELPGPVEALAGNPVDGDVFDDPVRSPCRELIAAARGATVFSVVDVCSRADTGEVVWREQEANTVVKLDPPAPIDMAPLAADMDGDGHVDVLVGAAGKVYIARSDGNALSTAVPYRLPLSNDTEISPDIPMPLAAGDFNGDGAPDFVFSDRLLTSRPSGGALPRYVIVHLNVGAPWTEAKIADLNANGHLDVVACSNRRLGIDFFNGTGGPYLTDFSFPTNGPVEHLAIADLDGDLIRDLAFVESAPSPSDRDTLLVAFGQLSGPPLPPMAVARIARTEEVSTFTADGRGSLIVSSVETVDGVEGGVLSLLAGSGDRMPFASLGLSTISATGLLANAASLGLSVGGFLAPGHRDLLALATNDFDARDWQLWLVPAFDKPESRPERLDWKLDPSLVPAYLVDRDPVLAWVGASADLNGDGRDEALWAMSSVDHEHCALVVIGAAPGSMKLGVLSTVQLDESCGRAQLLLADADSDRMIDVAILTGLPGSATRKLLVLWNQGEGRFSRDAAVMLNPTSESPQSVAFLRPIPGRAAAFAYVTDESLALVELAAERQFATPRVLAPLARGTGIASADVNGDGADDLAIAASGNLLLLKAELKAP